ncbi:MAG: hypothetical protein MJA27_24880, partial [Pseudanabaenales cyanobacterium]|nr:hypothetical protein [Pseudanabaenales cyanobacterium]
MAAWRAGREPTVERRLAHAPDAQVFSRDPSKTAVRRILSVAMVLSGGVMVWLLLAGRPNARGWREYANGTVLHETLELSRAEIERFFSITRFDPVETSFDWFMIEGSLNQFSVYHGRGAANFNKRWKTESLKAARHRLRHLFADDVDRSAVFTGIIDDRAAWRHVATGLFSLEELTEGRWTRVDVAEDIVSNPRSWTRMTTVNMGGRDRVRHDTRRLRSRLEPLAWWGLVDQLDLSEAADKILASQITPETPPPSSWRDHRLDGLFLASRDDPIQDTADALRILELAGALDRIDREACVRGILRLHRGGGVFMPEKPAPPTASRGTAQNTWCAFESLRVLNALDAVRDLRRW